MLGASLADRERPPWKKDELVSIDGRAIDALSRPPSSVSEPSSSYSRSTDSPKRESNDGRLLNSVISCAHDRNHEISWQPPRPSRTTKAGRTASSGSSEYSGKPTTESLERLLRLRERRSATGRSLEVMPPVVRGTSAAVLVLADALAGVTVTGGPPVEVVSGASLAGGCWN